MTNKFIDTTNEESDKFVEEIQKEIEIWEYFASTLEQEHQMSLRSELDIKVKNLKEILKEKLIKK